MKIGSTTANTAGHEPDSSDDRVAPAILQDLRGHHSNAVDSLRQHGTLTISVGRFSPRRAKNRVPSGRQKKKKYRSAEGVQSRDCVSRVRQQSAVGSIIILDCWPQTTNCSLATDASFDSRTRWSKQSLSQLA